ncbi:MAG: succinate dehydrogenase cytochrome b subunit [Chloroflexi bacterium]|nr:succinate dehydrogenase cytochrome b subunit [Chloroflexota bacterium]
MAAALTLYRSTIGKKAIMALSGIIWYGFVIVHMIGNFKIFEGAEAFNKYSHFLREVGYPAVPEGTILWVIRIVLLVSLVMHVLMAIQLTRLDVSGRPVAYKKKRTKQASFASMTLRYGGLAILFFVVYHLLHFTTGAAHPDFEYGNPYNNVVIGFTAQPLTAVFYIVAVAALGTHLYHGVWSALQTLGLNNRRSDKLFRGVALLSGVVLFLGFAMVPVSVLLGIVK